MRIDRVKYTAHYDEFGVLKDQWIGLEGQIDDTEVPEKKLDEIKAITESWYAKQNPHLQPQGPPVYDGNLFPGPRIIEVKPEDKETGVTPETLLSCSDIMILEAYRLIVKGKPELEQAYALRHDQLTINYDNK